MANFFTNLLNSLSGDLEQTNLKDYQHASRLYVQNFYRLAPKHGFLYFVKFNLNPKVADGEAWRSSRQDLELGMLVKKCDLPKITMQGTTLNIYNRKTPVYTKVEYQPLNMTLHDDNAGLVRSFWQMYYQYYVADSYYGGYNAAPGTLPINPVNRYTRPAAVSNQQLQERANPNAANYVNTTDPGRYGLDTNTGEQMIRSIEIYQLSRKQFFLHTLINPKIRSWNQDTLDQGKTSLMEHNITIEYEGVYYGKGKVTRYTPGGWTDLHYDLDPSPIGGLFGRGDGGLLGPNGVIQDGTDLFQDLVGIKDNPQADQRAALATLIRGAKLISNAYNLDYGVAREQLAAATVSNIGLTVAENGGNSFGLIIPRKTSTETTTTATASTVTTKTSVDQSALRDLLTPDASTSTQVSGGE